MFGLAEEPKLLYMILVGSMDSTLGRWPCQIIGMTLTNFVYVNIFFLLAIGYTIDKANFATMF